MEREAISEAAPEAVRQSEEVTEAVGGGCCRLQMPLKLALDIRGTVAGHRLGALEGGGGGAYLPPFQCIPGGAPPLPMHRWGGGGVVWAKVSPPPSHTDCTGMCNAAAPPSKPL